MKRGEIYWVNPPPGQGSVQSGRRPGLIIQNDTGNLNSPVTIVAVLTSSRLTRIYPTDVLITAVETGLPQDSKVLCNQIFTVARTALGAKIGEVPTRKMALVNDALKESLGIL